MAFLRPKPWRSRAPFSGHLVTQRRRGGAEQGGAPFMSTDDPFAWDDDRSGEAVVAVGTALAIEQPDAVRSPQGWIDESGLLAFNRRSVDMELGHDSFGGRRPPSVSAGRRSA